MLDNQNIVDSVSNLNNLHYLNSDREVSLENTLIVGYNVYENNNLTESDIITHSDSLIDSSDMDEYEYCNGCGKLTHQDDYSWTTNDTCYCNECFSSHTFYCEHCDRDYDIDFSEYYETNENSIICERCRDNYYGYCGHCENLFYSDDLYWNDENECYYCESCNESLGSYQLNSYYYKPTPNFLKTDSDKATDEYDIIYTGIEDEIEQKSYSSMNDDIRTILDMLNNKVYCKYDGSLDRGMEIVSHPFTLNYVMQNNSKVIDTTRYLIDRGYRSDETSTCGLHIHINRTCLGFDTNKQNENIEKLILFFETYKNEIHLLSRRSFNGYARFISDTFDTSDKKDKLKCLSLDYIKKDSESNTDRRRAINLRNTNTIEFRVFRGTLNYKTILATIEFINNLVLCIRENPIEKISFSKVINYRKTEYLKDYVKNRNIKANYKYLHDYTNYLNKLNAIENRKKDKIYSLILDLGINVESCLKELVKNESYFNNLLFTDANNNIGYIVANYKNLIDEYNYFKVKNIDILKKQLTNKINYVKDAIDYIYNKNQISLITYNNFLNTNDKLVKEVM